MAEGKHAGGRPLKFKTPEDLRDKGMAYLRERQEAKLPITITGLAIALDTSRETLMNYEKRDEYFDTIKRLKAYCEDYAEQSIYIGKNAAGGIFALKNFGWRDKTEQDISVKELPKPILSNIIEEEDVRTDDSSQEALIPED